MNAGSNETSNSQKLLENQVLVLQSKLRDQELAKVALIGQLAAAQNDAKKSNELLNQKESQVQKLEIKLKEV